MRAFVLASVMLLACEARPPAFHGVELGMAPREVRDHVDIHGAFEVEPTADDFKMRLVPEAGSAVTSAQFEFHMGALVAVRADVSPRDPAAKGDALLVTKSAVLHRERNPERVHIDLLARDCPTHATEAAKLVSAH